MTEDGEELTTIVVGEHIEAHEDVQTEVQAQEQVQDWALDPVCADAVELARQVLAEEAEAGQIGEHLGAIAEGPSVVTHYFAGTVPGYVGWRWAVTVTRAPDSDDVTVDETALLPDADALLAPAWVPWKQRIQSGDLGAGDVLLTEPDDPRLVAGMADNDAPDADDDLRPLQWEVGLGRVRVLSPEGRREAAHRWYREVGPRAPIARAADLHCASCGFLMLIGGPLGQAFGVCANGFSPVDGRVVAMTFGCGAHSETLEKPPLPVTDVVIDEMAYDPMPDEPDEPEEPDHTEATEATDASPAELEPDRAAEAQPADKTEPADPSAQDDTEEDG